MKNNGAERFHEPAPPADGVFKVKDGLYFIFEIVWLFVIQLLPHILWALVNKLFPPPGKSLKGQVALVTGGARGLGKGLALALAQEGCKVAVADVNKPGAEKTAEEIRRYGGQAEAYFYNIAKVDEVKMLREAVSKDLGPVDILVNNAGLVHPTPIETCSEAAIVGVLQVNLISHFWMAREFLPSMRERNHGHIVAISSAAAFRGPTNASAYVASKCGVKGFMEVLRLELNAVEGNRIKTTTVCPGFINTSADYVKHWDLRLPPMTTEEAVKATIAAVKLDKVIITVPDSLYAILHITRILPQAIVDKFDRITFTKHSPLSKEEEETDSSARIIRDLQTN